MKFTGDCWLKIIKPEKFKNKPEATRINKTASNNMAHMIDNSKGFNAFVAYGTPGWHGLGKVFQTELTAQQALIESGNDFTVLKMPNTHHILTVEGQEIETVSDSSFFTYRTDTNAILGDKLGKVYEVLQNSEAFAIVDEILQKGRARIETAGALDGGKKVFVCLKIDKSLTVKNDDTINQYLLIVSSHDGSMSITATETPVRVVCNNTLTAALRGAKGAIKIRHTPTASDRLKEAMKVLNMLDDNADILTEQFNKMAETVISGPQMFDYFGSVFCTPEEIKEFQQGKRAQQVLSTQKQNILRDVDRFALTGVGQKETLLNGNPTLWTAYNAVTGYVAHKRKFTSANDRANSMLFGSSADLIKDAGILAAEPAKIQKLTKISFDNSSLN